MTVTCSECGLSYDDTFKLTFCPHEEFEMDTLVVRGDGQEKRVHSIEDLNAFIEGK